jgi:hypothetical protein
MHKLTQCNMIIVPVCFKSKPATLFPLLTDWCACTNDTARFMRAFAPTCLGQQGRLCIERLAQPLGHNQWDGSIISASQQWACVLRAMQEATAELVEAVVEMRISSGPPSEAALAGLMSLLQAVQTWMNLNLSLRALLQWWKAGIIVDTRPEGPLFTEHKLADFLVKQVLVSCGVPLSPLCAS